MKIALLQMDVKLGAVKANRDKAVTMMQQAVAGGAKLIVLPELWTTGYRLDLIHELAETADGPTVKMLRTFAAEHGVEILAGSIAEKNDGRVYNSSYAISADGALISHYRKIHLIGLMQEDQFIAPGQKRGEVQFSFGKAGLIICYDLRFTELSRALALAGCQTLFVPAEWPTVRGRHWTALNIARAIENQMFVIAVNRVGSDDKNVFYGHSMVVDPWGDVLAEATETEEEVILVDVNFGSVAEIRERIPVFRDRRPLLY